MAAETLRLTPPDLQPQTHKRSPTLAVSSLKDMLATEFAVDPHVQRELNEPRVKKLVDEFDPNLLGLIIASKRPDGRTYILDGQHRVVAARRKGYTGLFATRVYEGLTVAEEADAFLGHNNTRQVSALDKFLVRVTKGDPGAVALNNALNRYGLKASGQHTGGMFSAIVALERVYAGFLGRPMDMRLDLVEAVLHILTRAYGAEERKAFQANTIQGVGLIIRVFGKRVNPDDLVTALRSITAEALAVKGRAIKDMEGGTGAQGVAKVLLKAYNKGKSANRLEFTEFNDGLAQIKRLDWETYDRRPGRRSEAAA
jgi:hypothetical protein